MIYDNLEYAKSGQMLYNPDYEHDACGVGLLLNIDGKKSHKIVDDGLLVLENMVHRGAEGADVNSGDGAGIMLQIPHEFILLQGIAVPEKGCYGTGLLFTPKDEKRQELILETLTSEAAKEGLTLMAVRSVPTDNSMLGPAAKAAEPAIKQVFIIEDKSSELTLEVKLYRLRRRLEKGCSDIYFPSLSSKNIIYKGMLSSTQLRHYFLDLQNRSFTSGIALVHSRFSTNTFPTWALAQPFRLLGHNGEINTIRGNRLWSEARESVLQSPNLGDEDIINPVVQKGMSDSASLDNMLEFFTMSGMSLPHALAMLVPQSFSTKNPISPELKAFYEYHSIMMEAWDGPATLLFSDGRYAGGMLDRNGLRPARYARTSDGMMVIASEAGVLALDSGNVVERGRLEPGKIMVVDTHTGQIMYDEQIKSSLAAMNPYGEWLRKNRIHLEDITSGRKVSSTIENLDTLQSAFGYFNEEIEKLLIPMAQESHEPIGSMGNDTPVALFADKPQTIFNYFRQQFAQVTNPPIDPIREELVMSLEGYIGAIDKNLLEPSAQHCKMVHVKQPILTNRDIDILRHIDYKGFRTMNLDMTFAVSEGVEGMKSAVESLCEAAENAVEEQFNYIILSDKGVNAERAAIPAVMAISAVHHHLIAKHKRTKTALIIETGQAREVMHFALLTGFGASAINPYVAYGIIDKAVKDGAISLDYQTAEKNFIKAVGKGLLKIMSKMGISTIGSYRGAKLFEAVGLSTAFCEKYFPSLSSAIGGSDEEDIFEDVMKFHTAAYSGSGNGDLGFFSFRKEGERHAWNPETIAKLQIATRLGDYNKFKEYTSIINSQIEPLFIRDRLTYEPNPIDISLVEPVESILKRFVTGAMSFGSISKEAHEALAIAMNRIGGKSNTGEGGEDPERFAPRENGDSARSAIKQVASGRFGVTTNYLVNADELQIKVAQGAKPGEGGQLPGYKVDEIIAKTRHSIPGISLISPPPHHDIYSIEDLAQLIYDLKNVNPKARISVKLVSESGIGTIAAGVAKAKADAIIISGCEGGTGASPSSSIRHTGIPSEIGLAEVQQTLIINNLRSRVSLQVDGQIKTGRDIVIEAMLGAEEFGFATSALIVLGCVMMRKCHLNTCPVGVATQNAELRGRFKGDADYLVNFFTFLAEEVREILAEMGFTKLDAIIGRTDLLTVKAPTGISKVDKADFSKILAAAPLCKTNSLRKEIEQEKDEISAIRRTLLDSAKGSIENKIKTNATFTVCNTDRAVGATLAGEVAMRYGEEGLPNDCFIASFKGSAGQSFGAFLTKGLTFVLEGEANDYLGKGLSGGKIIVKPSVESTFNAAENVIAGNTLLYGATSGEVYISGKVGERFCIRNSGVRTVVEGAGEHCCEYMTGGRVVVLGATGSNFGAGMSGGVAYIWDKEGDFDSRCNMEMVELSLLDSKADNDEILELLENHYRYTNSAAAKEILDNKRLLREFIKVVPIEYKKVLHEEQMLLLQQRISEVERDY
ncbi:MAG: glutamate synthase large subunit [Rikenellaceae bacterium]